MSSLSEKEVAQDIALTDPPYYDAIPYSDLMDFFLYMATEGFRAISVQQLKDIFSRPLLQSGIQLQKDGELIEDESRHNGDKLQPKKAYEDGMANLFCAAMRL